MNIHALSGKESRIVVVARIVLSLCALAVGGVQAATTPIYKCLDRNLGVVYTDLPCKDGHPLDIRAGDADPAAVARLDRARDALNQSFAQRIADTRREAALAGRAPRIVYQAAEEDGSYGDGPAYAYISGYGFASNPFKHRHPIDRMRHGPPTAAHPLRFAPPPHVFSRR